MSLMCVAVKTIFIFKKVNSRGRGQRKTGEGRRKKEERKASKHLLSTYYLPGTVYLGFTNLSILLTLVQNNCHFYE